jgi:hypothetical protein
MAFTASIVASNKLVQERFKEPIIFSQAALERIKPFLPYLLELGIDHGDEEMDPHFLPPDLLAQGILPLFKPPPDALSFQRYLQTQWDSDHENSMINPSVNAALFFDNAGSADWLTSLPSHPGLIIPDSEYITLLRARLNWSSIEDQLLPKPPPPPRPSRTIMDEDPFCPLCGLVYSEITHPYTCRQVSGSLIARHDRVVSILSQYLDPPVDSEVTFSTDSSRSHVVVVGSKTNNTSSNCSLKEKLSVLRNKSLIRADLWLPPSKTAVDVTIVSSSSTDKGMTQSFQRAISRKKSKYRPLIARGVISELVPFPISPFGSLAPSSLLFLSDHVSLKSQVPLIRRLISISVARGTARTIMSWMIRAHDQLIHPSYQFHTKNSSVAPQKAELSMC